MSEKNNILDFNKALQAIELITDNFNVSVWVPNLQKEITFKEVDAKQQKNLLSSALNASVYNTSFVKTFYNIIKDNIVIDDKESILPFISIFDKVCIALTLKKQISPDIKVVFDEKNEVVKTISVDPIIEKFKTFSVPKNETINFESEGFNLRLEIGVPSIVKEFQYEEEIHKKDKKIDDIKNVEEVKNIVSEAFISETSKYVNEIWVNGEALNYENFTVNQKIALIEKIPSAIIQKILKNVGDWKKQLDDVLTVELPENEAPNGQKYTKVLTIDSMLFLS